MPLSSRRELTARQLGWLVLAYVVVEGASVAARSLGSPVLPPFRLATGIAVVAFALVSRRLLPWLVVGQLGLQFTVLTVFGRISSPLLHLVQASGIVLECAAGGVLYARFSKPGGSSLREVVVVLASALLPAGLVAIPMAAAFNVFVPEMNLAVLPDALDWVTAESVGVMLLVPLVLSPRDLAAAPLSGRQVVGMVTGALLSTVLMGSFFFTQFTVASPALALSFTVFPLFLLAGYVGGLRGAAIGGVLLSGLVTAAAMWVVGPFSVEDTNFARHTFAQVFVVLVTASSLLVGGLTEDERRARRSLAQTLQALHDSTSRLQALFATAPEATAIFDQAGAVVAVNEAFVTLARRSCGTAPVPGEARGAFEARAGQAWLKANAGGWERALAGDPVVMQLDAHDGAGPLELRFEAVRDARGVVIGVAQRLVDVDAATRDQQRRARGERLESLGRLAGGIAHDFNNLLAVIIGHASALSDSGLPGEASEDAAEIVSAGKRAAVLTRQLLQFARREQVEPRVVDLAEQTRALLPLLERLAGESIKLEVEEQGGPLTLSMAPGHLEQVLLNVVANARDAMPEGGHIWLRLRSEELGPAAAKEREVAPGPMVVLEVEDDGTGMPPELLERIFEPFFSTKPAGKGTGLGLATTDGIIRQAHGAITVTSAVAQGTTFRFYFPRSDGPVDDTEPPPVLTPSGGHETILLVEDECSLRALAARVLRKAGYRVLEAERGDTALAVARAHAEGIDLLISDVVLPGGSGPSVAETLRRERPKLKVLLVSGYSDVPLASVPDSAFLAKPYTPAQLLDLARTTLGRGGT